MPFPVFREPERIDEGIFSLSGRLVFAPRVSVVLYYLSFADEFLGVLKCCSVQFHCHIYLFPGRHSGERLPVQDDTGRSREVGRIAAQSGMP
jgi:hypothetical protein